MALLLTMTTCSEPPYTEDLQHRQQVWLAVATIILCVQIHLVNMVQKTSPQQPKAQWNLAEIEAFLTYLISVKSTMAGTDFKEVTFNAAAQEIASKRTSGPLQTRAQCKNKWGLVYYLALITSITTY